MSNRRLEHHLQRFLAGRKLPPPIAKDLGIVITNSPETPVGPVEIPAEPTATQQDQIEVLAETLNVVPTAAAVVQAVTPLL